MTNFKCVSIKSVKYLIICVILILQGCQQYEAKRFMDIYTTFLGIILPQNNHIFKFINGSLTFPAEMQNATLARPQYKTHPGITVHVIFGQEVTDMKVNFNISIERNGHYDTYLSMPIDFCEAAYSKIDTSFIRFFRNEILRVLKPAHRCPYQKDVRYEINDFMVRNTFVPVYTPDLKWKAEIAWHFNGGQHFLTLIVMGRLEWINI